MCKGGESTIAFAKNLMLLLAVVAAAHASLFAQKGREEALPSLTSRFQATRDLEAKERFLNEITTGFPDAGPALLELAETTADVDSKWMAIRGIGTLKYEKAVPFLVESLRSEHHYVRANSARALGDMRVRSAGPALISLLRGEQDGGVIEQASLALWMIGARAAVPVLKAKASHPSIQTRMWVLQAIGYLGSRADVPFLAGYLYGEPGPVSMASAKAIEVIVGVDFGFPKQGVGSPDEGVQKARIWWEAHKSCWAPTSTREAPAQ